MILSSLFDAKVLDISLSLELWMVARMVGKDGFILAVIIMKGAFCLSDYIRSMGPFPMSSGYQQFF